MSGSCQSCSGKLGGVVANQGFAALSWALFCTEHLHFTYILESAERERYAWHGKAPSNVFILKTELTVLSSLGHQIAQGVTVAETWQLAAPCPPTFAKLAG